VPLYTVLHNLLNVLVEIVNKKMRLPKRKEKKKETYILIFKFFESRREGRRFCTKWYVASTTRIQTPYFPPESNSDLLLSFPNT
jgi:hypothetical protein